VDPVAGRREVHTNRNRRDLYRHEQEVQAEYSVDEKAVGFTPYTSTRVFPHPSTVVATSRKAEQKSEKLPRCQTWHKHPRKSARFDGRLK
jgi:hypothetical protein